MKKCPKCNIEYPDSLNVCIKCNLQLFAESLENRLGRLENKANQILKEIAEIRTGKALEEVVEKVELPAQQSVSKIDKKEDTQTQIGKYVLNKIGVISLVAGAAFLIAYTFKYLMPIHKILIEYAIASLMLLLSTILSLITFKARKVAE